MSRGEEAVPPFSLHAWVDESITIADARGHGGYVLAAVIADPLHCDILRDKLKDLVPPRQKRLHWSIERAPRRDRITQAVADHDLAAIATVGTPVRDTTQERARHCCLEQLLLELQQVGVSQVWLESRPESLNRSDLAFVENLHGGSLITRGLRVSFRRPLDEPMLWLPDAVAGAVTAARRGEPRWLQKLASTVTLVDVRVR